MNDQIPSRASLEAAERHNDSVGHELDGFLSASAGFIPKRAPVLAFPQSHAAWDDIVARMPELWRTVSVRRALGELPILMASSRSAGVRTCLAGGFVAARRDRPGRHAPDARGGVAG